MTTLLILLFLFSLLLLIVFLGVKIWEEKNNKIAISEDFLDKTDAFVADKIVLYKLYLKKLSHLGLDLLALFLISIKSLKDKFHYHKKNVTKKTIEILSTQEKKNPKKRDTISVFLKSISEIKKK